MAQWVYRDRNGTIHTGTEQQLRALLNQDYSTGVTGQFLWQDDYGAYHQDVSAPEPKAAQKYAPTSTPPAPNTNIPNGKRYHMSLGDDLNILGFQMRSGKQLNDKSLQKYIETYTSDPNWAGNKDILREYNDAANNIRYKRDSAKRRKEEAQRRLNTPNLTSEQLARESQIIQDALFDEKWCDDASKRLGDRNTYVKRQRQLVNSGKRTDSYDTDAIANYDSTSSEWGPTKGQKIVDGAKKAGNWIKDTAKKVADGTTIDLQHGVATAAGERMVNAITGNNGKDETNMSAWDRANANLAQQQAAEEQKRGQYVTQQGTRNYRVEADKNAASAAAAKNAQKVNNLGNVSAGAAALERGVEDSDNQGQQAFAANQYDKGAAYARNDNKMQQLSNVSRAQADLRDYDFRQNQYYNDTSNSLSMGGYNTQAGKTTDNTQQTKQETKQQTTQPAQETTQPVQDTTENTQDTTQQTTQPVQDTTENTQDNIQQTTQPVQQPVRQSVQFSPKSGNGAAHEAARINKEYPGANVTATDIINAIIANPKNFAQSYRSMDRRKWQPGSSKNAENMIFPEDVYTLEVPVKQQGGI